MMAATTWTRGAEVAGASIMPILEHMYAERLLEHFQNPRNVGELAPPAVTVEVSNPACGDILRLSVRFEGDVAAEVRYKVRGCTASIAAGSALTEWMVGKTRGELARFEAAIVDEAVGGLPAESRHAAVLCADGVRKVLAEREG
jgi:nitrogen fixation NifU-like protein